MLESPRELSLCAGDAGDTGELDIRTSFNFLGWGLNYDRPDPGTAKFQQHFLGLGALLIPQKLSAPKKVLMAKKCARPKVFDFFLSFCCP
jgi:hypothetical protein